MQAKKKVALLLQKLKKYELPELPPSVHDPELFTPEQLQAYKKIGFRNKNYVPVGVRGVFGGVVQNMHLHWKFHETVQICCDNFPKEKIKEMATMIARLSGGIVINIHNVKTIIMFRGRNYRQPKNLIPFNTLTKRKVGKYQCFSVALNRIFILSISLLLFLLIWTYCTSWYFTVLCPCDPRYWTELYEEIPPCICYVFVNPAPAPATILSLLSICGKHQNRPKAIKRWQT